MILPSAGDLAAFEHYNAADFSRWLKVGLESYLFEDQGAWGFEHIGVFLQGEEHLALALANVYRAFPAQKRAAFRGAVACVMATLEADPLNAPMFEHLLAIAAVLPAPEILDILPVKIGNGFFGAMDVEGENGLFEKTLDTIIDLAAPTEASRACLEMLVGSRNFNVAYSGIALLTLCRLAPAGFVEHMNLLRAPLAKMFEKFETDEETKKRLAEEIEIAVTVFTLAENLRNLRLGERGDTEDMWFFRNIGIHFDHRNVPYIRSLKEPSVEVEIESERTQIKAEQEKTNEDRTKEGPAGLTDSRVGLRGTLTVDEVHKLGSTLFGDRFEEGIAEEGSE